jgi:hypothetical protein
MYPPPLLFNTIDQENVICLADLWVIIHGKVYDLTEFLPEHPGK